MADVYLTIRPYDLKVSHVWRTSIQNIYNGNEKRSMLFTWPRVNMEASFILPQDNRINWFKRHLIRHDDLVWGVPIWSDETEVTSQATLGQPIINVGDTTNRHFYVGRECIIIDQDDFLLYEMGTIQSLTSTSITLTTNLAETWYADAIVLPLYDFRIDIEQEIVADFQWIQDVELRFTEEYSTQRSFTYTLPTTSGVVPTYLAHDLFLHELLNPVKYKFKRPYQSLQSLGIGYNISQLEAGLNYMRMETSLLYNSRSDIWDLLEFFDSKQGRLLPLWLPTWSKDIVATASGILATDTVINIENIAYTNFYYPNEVIGRHVYIEFPDNTYVCRKITASAELPTSTITLDSQIGTAVSLANLPNLLISFLTLSRFDIDTIELEYLNKPDLANVNLNFAALLDWSIIGD